MKKIAALVIAIAASLSVLASAQAEPAAVIPGAALPVTRADGPVVIQLNAPAGSWTIRKAARAMDAQLADVTVRTSGDCSTADVCIAVVMGDWTRYEMTQMAGTSVAWAGLTTYPTDTTRVIYLNNRTGIYDRANTAAHEFGHALGLNHHAGHGVTGDAPSYNGGPLSNAEIAAITRGVVAARAAIAAQR